MLAHTGTYSFVYGVLGDLTTPADRGGYIGFTSVLYAQSTPLAVLCTRKLLI